MENKIIKLFLNSSYLKKESRVILFCSMLISITFLESTTNLSLELCFAYSLVFFATGLSMYLPMVHIIEFGTSRKKKEKNIRMITNCAAICPALCTFALMTNTELLNDIRGFGVFAMYCLFSSAIVGFVWGISVQGSIRTIDFVMERL